MNQAFEKPWPARCRAKPKSRESAGLKNTTASAARHPPLVPPNESTSIPAFQVNSAGVTPEARHRAGKARPVHVHGHAALLGHRGDRRHLGGAVGRAELGDLRDAGDHRPPVMDVALGIALDRPGQCVGRVLAVAALDADDLGAAEELRCAGLVDIDVRVAVAEDDAAGARIVGDAEGVGRRPGADQEDRHLALEQLGEALCQAAGEVVIAIGPAAMPRSL